MSERSWYLGGRAIALLTRLWRLTIRIHAENRAVLVPPYVLALWHGRILGSLMDNFDSRCVTMASQSNDGALAAGIVEGLGLRAMRGSSSRGGRDALREMEGAIAAGAPFAALTVDGPKGPWRKVKPGIIVLARQLGLPIIPVTNTCTRPLLLRSWDRMVLPRPFSRVVVRYGQPISPAELRGQDAIERIASALETLTQELDSEMLGRALWPPR